MNDKNNKKIATLITHIRVKPNFEKEFLQWHEKMLLTLNNFSGFISETISHPKLPLQPDWVIFQDFLSKEIAQKWLNSDQRSKLFENELEFLEAIDNIYIVENKRGFVTATFSAIINDNDKQSFLNLNAKILETEAKFPGFVGHKLEKPLDHDSKTWTTIVTFDSDENLENWLNSDERKKLINELNKFVSKLSVSKTYSGFDFWFEESKGKKRSLWKENMIVLLGLYPIVFFLSFFMNFAIAKGVPFWLALFFSNAASTVMLGYWAVPFLMNLLSWWINPPKEYEKKYSAWGTLIVVICYLVSLTLCCIIATSLTRK